MVWELPVTTASSLTLARFQEALSSAQVAHGLKAAAHHTSRIPGESSLRRPSAIPRSGRSQAVTSTSNTPPDITATVASSASRIVVATVPWSSVVAVHIRGSAGRCGAAVLEQRQKGGGAYVPRCHSCPCVLLAKLYECEDCSDVVNFCAACRKYHTPWHSFNLISRPGKPHGPINTRSRTGLRGHGKAFDLSDHGAVGDTNGDQCETDAEDDLETDTFRKRGLSADHGEHGFLDIGEGCVI